MPDALSYYAFRDQNLLTPEALAGQPGLSPDEAIRRIALTPGATFRPGEYESLMQMAAAAKQQQGQRDQINQFYDSPDRSSDIEKAVAPQEQQGFAQLLSQLHEASRQGAFARARSGNIGGSVQASQQVQLAGAGAGQGARMSAGFDAQRMDLQRALEAARTSELTNTYNMDPVMQQALGQRVHTYGVQGDTNAALDALRRQEDAMHNGQDDEYSRLMGNAVNIGTNLYTTSQNNGMADDYQSYLQSLRSRRGGAGSMPGSTPAPMGTN